MPPSRADLARALVAGLRRGRSTLQRLGLARLVRGGGFAVPRLRALLPGSFEAKMTGSPHAPGAAQTRVLARGSRHVASPGRYALRLKLTRAGRRVLRHARRTRLKLTIGVRDALGRAVKRRAAVVVQRRAR